MTATASFCRTCGGHDLEDLGPLPDVASFAGMRLESALAGGRLRACKRCDFIFRDPILAEAEYLQLYSKGSVDVWDSCDERTDFRLVRQLVPDEPIDVLDVGCYTGQLLASMPKSCRPHGIEPNAAAAAVAASRGVRIAGTHWHQDGDMVHYDVVIACDVIEHVDNPLEFLTRCAARLKPGGRVILTTGNAEAWLWRRMRSNFWYCHYPEHISFIGPKWLDAMAPVAGLRVNRLKLFRRTPSQGFLGQLMTVAHLAMYAVSPAAYRKLAAMVIRVPPDTVPAPGGSLTKDHLLCELIKA